MIKDFKTKFLIKLFEHAEQMGIILNPQILAKFIKEPSDQLYKDLSTFLFESYLVAFMREGLDKDKGVFN